MFVYEQSLKKKMCPNLVHNFKEFLVVEDLNQMREKKCANGKYSWAYEVDFDVMDLLMSKRNFPLKV